MNATAVQRTARPATDAITRPAGIESGADRNAAGTYGIAASASEAATTPRAGAPASVRARRDRPDGVADRDYRDLQQRDEGHVPDVETHDRSHADHADEQADEPSAAETVLPAGGGDGRGADERNRSDEQSRQGARDLLLRAGEEEPRQRDLDGAEDEQRPPVREQRPQLAAPRRERKEQRGADGGPQQDEERRRQLPHGNADHQVRDAPDHAHRSEEDPAAPCHPRVLAERVCV